MIYYLTSGALCYAKRSTRQYFNTNTIQLACGAESRDVTADAPHTLATLTFTAKDGIALEFIYVRLPAKA